MSAQQRGHTEQQRAAWLTPPHFILKPGMGWVLSLPHFRCGNQGPGDDVSLGHLLATERAEMDFFSGEAAVADHHRLPVIQSTNPAGHSRIRTRAQFGGHRPRGPTLRSSSQCGRRTLAEQMVCHGQEQRRDKFLLQKVTGPARLRGAGAALCSRRPPTWVATGSAPILVHGTTPTPNSSGLSKQEADG